MHDQFVTSALRRRALEILQAHWRPKAGYCVPNPAIYPHQWLWDSAFHSIAWVRLGDDRGVAELSALLAGQLDGGMVPHMRYGPVPRPPGSGRSWGVVDHPAADVRARRRRAGAVRVRGARRRRRPRDPRAALAAGSRRDPSGLIFIVHPWEAGNDHSPRWDGWGVPGTTPATYDQGARSRWNIELMRDVIIDSDGAATGSSRFMVCPAAFNAYAAFNARELGGISADQTLLREADELAH